MSDQDEDSGLFGEGSDDGDSSGLFGEPTEIEKFTRKFQGSESNGNPTKGRQDSNNGN